MYMAHWAISLFNRTPPQKTRICVLGKLCRGGGGGDNELVPGGLLCNGIALWTVHDTLRVCNVDVCPRGPS